MANPKCASLRQPLRKRIEIVRQSYVEDARWPSDFPFDEIPSQRRVRVTKEFIATTLVSELKGESPPHPDREYFREALHDSIVRMVGMLADQYSLTCVDDTNDLMQDCMVRVWKKLEKYDEAKGKFSTWVWWVCKSVLNGKYKKSCRYRKVFVAQGESLVALAPEHQYSDILSHEFGAAVSQLADQFPEKKKFIYEIFGDPNTKGYIPPKLARIAESARNIGMQRGEATLFYTKVVRPFMRDRFKHERSQDGKAERGANVLRSTMGGVRV